MPSFGGWGRPGQGAAAYTTEKQLFWSGDREKGFVVTKSGFFDGTIRDAGNTPTTVIRPGLLLAKLDSNSFLTEWDADATDGSQKFIGINEFELRAQDFDGNNADRSAPYIVQARVKAAELLIQGTAFTSHIDEHLARRLMVGAGYVFDDDPQGLLSGLIPHAEPKATSYTVLEDDNGAVFFAHTADATFTLPTIRPGLSYEFVRASDHELVVASAEGDNIIGGNDLAGDSITFTTAGEQIGARVCFESHYVNGTLKWLYYIKKVQFSTDDVLASSFAT